MRILSLLVLSVLIHSACLAYTVILKSGKRLEGRLWAEDDSTLQLKDRDGTVLSFKKAVLDEPAMVLANVPKQPADGSVGKSNLQPRTSIRVYKKDDLDKMPTLSIVQGDSEESPYEGIETSFESPLSRSDPKEERSWRSRSASLKKELGRLRERKISAEASCAQARENSASRLAKPQRKPVNVLSLMGQPSACKMFDEVSRQLEEAEERWDAFETEARRSEVPWQWLE